MIRRLVTFASAMSLVLFITCVVGYFVSHSNPSQVVFVRGGYCWDLTLTSGGVGMGRYDGWPHDEPAIASTPARHPINRIHIGYVQHPTPFGAVTTGNGAVLDSANMASDPWGNPAHTSRLLLIGIRLGNTALLALVLPCMWAVAWLRRRRKVTHGFDVEPVKK